MAIVIPSATFLHIPKCGGSWAIQAMSAAGLNPQVEPAGCQHAIAATDGRFVFTFVRHPVSWYPSFWKFRWHCATLQGGSIEDHLRQYATQADESIDECLVDRHGHPNAFANFVEACMVRHPGFLSHKYSLYTSKAHFVGRQESLRDDLLIALRVAGAVFDSSAIRTVPKANVASERFPAEYPAGLANLVLRAESAAVEQFYGSALAGCTRAA